MASPGQTGQSCHPSRDRGLLGIAQVVLAAAMGINVTITGWVCTKMISNGERLSSIETRLAIPINTVPRWFEDRFDKFEVDVKDRLDRMQASINTGIIGHAKQTRSRDRSTIPKRWLKEQS